MIGRDECHTMEQNIHEHTEKNLQTRKGHAHVFFLPLFHFFLDRLHTKSSVCVFLLNRVQRSTKCETHLTIRKWATLYSNAASRCVWIEAQDWQRRKSVFNIRQVECALRSPFNSPIHSAWKRRRTRRRRSSSRKPSLSAMQNLVSSQKITEKKKRKRQQRKTKVRVYNTISFANRMCSTLSIRRITFNF